MCLVVTVFQYNVFSQTAATWINPIVVFYTIDSILLSWKTVSDRFWVDIEKAIWEIFKKNYS